MSWKLSSISSSGLYSRPVDSRSWAFTFPKTPQTHTSTTPDTMHMLRPKMEAATLPAIHSNGNSGKEMLAAYEKAHEAFLAFVDTFNAIDFNARNYYVNDEGGWLGAVAAKVAIQQHLREVDGYLEDHLLHIDAQVNR